MGRWMLVTEIRVDETSDPVNYAWVDHRLVPMDRKEKVDG
jgi:hypothetical protein